VYQSERNWRLAAETWETVVRIQAEAYGAEDLRLANSLDDLSVAYKQLASIPQAEAVLHRALAIRELNQGPTHTDVAHTTDELGQLLYGAGRYAEAEPFFERSLEVYTAFWGPGNPQLTRNLDNLAVTEAMLQKLVESAEHYGAALKIRDGETALNLHHLALIQAADGHPEAAEPLYRRLLTLLDTPGNGNPELRATAAKEFETIRRDLPVKRGKAPVAAKQK
jgi:tetratricopeptide (TPR) repeat protein